MMNRSNKEVLEYVRDNADEIKEAADNNNVHAIKIMNLTLSYMKCPDKQSIGFMNCEINKYEENKNG